ARRRQRACVHCRLAQAPPARGSHRHGRLPDICSQKHRRQQRRHRGPRAPLGRRRPYARDRRARLLRRRAGLGDPLPELAARQSFGHARCPDAQRLRCVFSVQGPRAGRAPVQRTRPGAGLFGERDAQGADPAR
ncbi:hypothetical protein LPJ56_006478, partial [Coemansia sp. RSA 2599]